jgi:AraC family transcriptional regulator
MLEYADKIREEATLNVLPRMPLLSNYKLNPAGVNGIYISYHQQPAWEMPEIYSSFHMITMGTTASSGCLERWIDGRLQNNPNAAACDLAVVPAQMWNRASWSQDADFMMITLQPWSLAHIAHEFVDPDSIEIIPHFNTADPQLYQLGMLCKAELLSPSHCSDIYMDSLKTLFAVHILRRYTNYQGRMQEVTGGLPKSKLMQAIAYINEHIGEELSLQTIASELKMSPCYFAKLFKISTGISVHQYVLQSRIRRAKELLAHSELKIVDIALKVGFQCQTHFGKVFRKQIGVTPKGYREAIGR